jgi:hypothetical protein
MAPRLVPPDSLRPGGTQHSACSTTSSRAHPTAAAIAPRLVPPDTLRPGGTQHSACSKTSSRAHPTALRPRGLYRDASFQGASNGFGKGPRVVAADKLRPRGTQHSAFTIASSRAHPTAAAMAPRLVPPDSLRPGGTQHSAGTTASSRAHPTAPRLVPPDELRRERRAACQRSQPACWPNLHALR